MPRETVQEFKDLFKGAGNRGCPVSWGLCNTVISVCCTGLEKQPPFVGGIPSIMTRKRPPGDLAALYRAFPEVRVEVMSAHSS